MTHDPSQAFSLRGVSKAFRYFRLEDLNLELPLGQQALILLAALAGSMGIAGIPNSGLIILTLVLKAAKLPEEVIAMALPVVYSIDFILARLRSAVNVMGDMQVAILLDVGERWGKSEAKRSKSAKK